MRNISQSTGKDPGITVRYVSGAEEALVGGDHRTSLDIGDGSHRMMRQIVIHMPIEFSELGG